ncbi:MAG: UDP-N-acetylmuramoyl-L-alanine--D-glutamate ligase [Chlamydiales bacterium]|nr:UDP-N-acetylmuramoyl-L-alanine--D-glutamate ligase [Chlamydiales bacterium]NCF70308.1 UDP-N-acetylmuramoyl-L-alanine--D-glutamate ligase [Chlamydiales bacterium]
MLDNWKLKKIVILGLGVSGRALADYLQSEGLYFSVVDDEPDKVEAALKDYPNSSRWDKKAPELLLYSPGIPLSHPAIKEAAESGAEVITEIAFALYLLRKRVKKIVGITGTNGKSTTTALLAHIFNHQGTSSLACGNIGVAVSALLKKRELPDYLFVELSSYQLEGLDFACLDAAIFTNIAKDHLDRYPSYTAYIDAKLNIASALLEGAPFFVEAQAYKLFPRYKNYKPMVLFGFGDNSSLYFNPSEGKITQDRVDYILKEEYRSNFLRNSSNLLAALGFCLFENLKLEDFLEYAKDFKALEHRLESVAEVNGVEIINDSKATNVASVVYAVESLSEPVQLIAGGKGKGEDFAAWQPFLETKLQKVFVLGEAQEKILRDLGPSEKVVRVADLKEAVAEALKTAKKGSKILLSPGCASFDMFKDYRHRGEVFKKLVRELTCEERNEP